MRHDPASSAPARRGNEWHVNPLDLVVLFCLCVFLVLNPPALPYLSYRWGHGSRLSGDVLGGACTALCTLLLLTYFGVAISGRGIWAGRVKLLVVLTLGMGCVLLPTVSDVLARRDLGLQVNGRQVSFAHDGGVLQTEAAVQFLLKGVSPYSADYSTTEMAQGADSQPELWRSLGFEENPAYRFFPYPPLTILLSLPFYLVAHTAFGWFDERLVYLVSWGVLAALGYRLPASPGWRLPLMTLLVFNPIAAPFFVIGRNDILCQTFLVSTVVLLTRERYRGASLLLGLACGVKQFAWILVPFYLAYLYARLPTSAGQSKWKPFVRLAWPLAASAGVVMVPFLVWDPQGFFRSLLWAQEAVYPFRSSSLGVANFLILWEAIHSFRDPFPLWAFQVFVVVPVCGYGVWRILRQRTVSAMLAWYAAALGLFLFFGRHFAHNYLAVVFTVMAMAWAIAHHEAFLKLVGGQLLPGDGDGVGARAP